MDFSEGCGVCGKELVYTAQHTEKECFYCGAAFASNVECPLGHFVCDDCHRSPANDLIEKYCNHSLQADPMKMAVMLMRSRVVKMHGPEHHFLVPAVLLASYFNTRNEKDKKKDIIAQARRRAELVPGGFCGTNGACGAALGAGIFVSLITGATPLSKEEWSLSNRITGKLLLEIAEQGGPRCCKRDSFIVIRKAVEFVRDEFLVHLPVSEVECEFHDRNKQCKFEDCQFYPRHTPLEN